MRSIILVLWILIVLLFPLFMKDLIPFQSVAHALSAPNPSPPPLIATEQEVRGFFDKYIELYNKREIEEFLLLFSLKVKQNQRDGLSEIRMIYSDFFNQSILLQNFIEDMKIEIYQNAAEVKARYQIDQILGKGGERRTWKGNIRWVLGKEDGGLKIISIDYQPQKSL